MTTSRILSRSIREVFAPYPHALLGRDRGIHRLRVGVRRLRVALRLLAGHPRGRRRRRADRRLKAIADAVAVSRDLDVGVELLERYPPLHEPGSPAWTALRQTLLAARARSRRKSRDRLLDLDLVVLRADLRAIGGHAPPDPARLRERFLARVDDEGLRVLERLHRAGRRFNPEALHEVRRGVRRLRYLAELDDLMRDRRSEIPQGLRALQGRIGEIYDRHVLATWLESRGKPSARPDRVARARAARSIRARVLADARRLHRELLDSDPAGVVRDALAALHPAEPPAADGNLLEFPGVS
ncbi:MAG TPA: CHAD domain-containing protein [Candidatus Polarisedimenticolaceae bacterium]|nr:CHAD domain-containing protein [Candidatus Polarisedimenticolaceae bacterium]